MKTFDYENAWLELALPQYKRLPNQVLVLVEEVSIVAANLTQNSACEMIWPDDGGKLRRQFEAIDSENLANAANVVYFYGHWRPSSEYAKNAPEIKSGGCWKFSNYADQVLRARFGVSRESNEMVGLNIIEGTIRLYYSSPDMWTWKEVAPATEPGMKQALEIESKLRRKLAAQNCRRNRDDAAWGFFRDNDGIAAWPDFDTKKYHVN